MRQLPSAGDSKNSELDKHPSDDTGVGGFGLVSELGLTFTLEDLLPANILQASVQVLDARRNVLELVLVGAFDLAALADGKVKCKADAAVVRVKREPAGTARGGRRGEAERVVAGVGSREGEAARCLATLGDYAVVVVEGFVDRDVDAETIVLGPLVGPLIVLLSSVVADDEGVLGELLEEALGRGAVDVEVERLRNGAQREQREERPHVGNLCEDSNCRDERN